MLNSIDDLYNRPSASLGSNKKTKPNIYPNINDNSNGIDRNTNYNNQFNSNQMKSFAKLPPKLSSNPQTNSPSKSSQHNNVGIGGTLGTRRNAIHSEPKHAYYLPTFTSNSSEVSNNNNNVNEKLESEFKSNNVETIKNKSEIESNQSPNKNPNQSTDQSPNKNPNQNTDQFINKKKINHIEFDKNEYLLLDIINRQDQMVSLIYMLEDRMTEIENNLNLIRESNSKDFSNIQSAINKSQLSILSSIVVTSGMQLASINKNESKSNQVLGQILKSNIGSENNINDDDKIVNLSELLSKTLNKLDKYEESETVESETNNMFSNSINTNIKNKNIESNTDSNSEIFNNNPSKISSKIFNHNPILNKKYNTSINRNIINSPRNRNLSTSSLNSYLSKDKKQRLLNLKDSNKNKKKEDVN